MGYELDGLNGKVAVVTGASRMESIGRSIAVELARAGCDVVITGTARPAGGLPSSEAAAGWCGAESVAEEVRSYGRRAITAVTDITDRAQVEELAERTSAELGRVDVVVNNASAPRGPDQVPVLDLEPDVWDSLVSINLTGTFNVSQVFARRMVAQGGGGSIVNIATISAKTADANFAAYSASKAGVLALTSSMARELAAAGIRVNALCPGLIRTNRVSDIWDSGRADSYISKNIPLGRAGRGGDIAAAVVFLCSENASWVTGQQWNVDGGQVTMR